MDNGPSASETQNAFLTYIALRLKDVKSQDWEMVGIRNAERKQNAPACNHSYM